LKLISVEYLLLFPCIVFSRSTFSQFKHLGNIKSTTTSTTLTACYAIMLR
jgi:hypothetical protein